HLHRSVSRTVVNNQSIPVSIILRNHGINGVPDESFTIVNRHQNSNMHTVTITQILGQTRLETYDSNGLQGILYNRPASQISLHVTASCQSLTMWVAGI